MEIMTPQAWLRPVVPSTIHPSWRPLQRTDKMDTTGFTVLRGKLATKIMLAGGIKLKASTK